MCELFAATWAEPTAISRDIKNFMARALFNPQGWGVGLYPESDSASALVLKEPIKATKSQLARFICDYPFESSIILSHIRYATEGVTAYRNTHPFCREFMGKDYVYIHNGKMNDYPQTFSDYYPGGDTDSEALFCNLMQWMKDKRIVQWSHNSFVELESKIRVLNNGGQLNCIFSNGKYIFCYRDINGYNGMMYRAVRQPDGDVEGYIITSKPISADVDWVDLPQGRLTVFCKNEILFQTGHYLI